MTIFASDLDNTLIYSFRKAEKDHICVEIKEGKPVSFMTPNSHSLLKQIIELVDFIPITTRSLEQYRRINFFEDYKPKLALVSNGGLLLVDDKIDELWYHETRRMVSGALDQLNQCLDTLNKDENISFEIRFVDGLFIFTKSKDAKQTVNHLNQLINKEIVTAFYHGSKVYIMPTWLNKGNSLKRLKEKFQNKRIICAGDSLFDISMLQLADIAITPIDNMNYEGNENYYIWNHENYFSDFVLENVKKII